MARNPVDIYKFIQSLKSLASKGNIKIDDAYRAAKLEFGEVSDLLKLQINKIFQQSKAPSIKKPENKPGEVIEASFKPGMDKRGKIVEESPSQASGIMKTDEASPLMKNIDEVKQNIKGMSENSPKTFGMPEEQRNALGYPNRMIEGIIRTAAREILSKKGIDVSKADPIDTFADIFGVNSLERLEDVSDELLTAQDYNQLNSILQKNELYDVTPKSGLNLKQSDEIEELTEFDPTDRKPNAMGGINRIAYRDGTKIPKLIKTGKKVIDSGKEGLESLINLINKKFGKGTAKTADQLESKSKLFDDFSTRNPDPNKQLTDDEIADLAEEVGELDAYDFDGTVGSANRIRNEVKAYEADMLKQYEAAGGSKRAGGPKDPVAEAIDNVSPGFANDLKYDAQLVADDLAEKRFGKEFYDLDQNQQMDLYDEAYQALSGQRSSVLKKKRKLIIPKDKTFDENLPFDNDAEKLAEIKMSNENFDLEKKILDEVDEAYGVTPEMKKQLDEMGGSKLLERFELKQKYPGIDEDLLTAIIDDPDPNNKAQVLSTFDQLMQLQKMGKTPEEAVEIVKQTMFKGRRDNAQGGFQKGLSYLMGM